MKKLALLLTVAALLAGPAASQNHSEELLAVETAFAQSAESRDVETFRGFLAEDVVFAGTGTHEMRGPEAILEGWAGFFAPDGPSISWSPQSATVVDDGSLGMTRGPYRVVGTREDGTEAVITGTFFSVWRRTEDGWKIVLDGGTQDPPVKP